MWKFLQSPLAQLVWQLAVLAVLIAVAIYIIAKVRDGPNDNDNDASELLAKFREFHSKGELSDEEFRTIKTQLAEHLQDK